MHKPRRKVRHKKIKKWLKRYWGTVCLLVAILMLCVTGTWASYTNFSIARRVVSVKDGSKVLFSSNLLYTEDKLTDSNSYRNRRVSLNSDNQFSLDIYNYVLGDDSNYNNHAIVYTLQITLLTGTESYDDYYVHAGDATLYRFQNKDGVYVASVENQRLDGNTLSKNSYSIYVPEADKNFVRFYIEAIPNDESYAATNNKKLAAGILIGQMTLEKNWTGYILDTQDGRTPNQYDGFNYEVSGYGKGTVTLSWNPNILEMNPWFFETVGSTAASDSKGWKTLQFQVGGDDQPSAYQTQFYWVGKPQDITWEVLLGNIQMNFTEN